MFKINTQIRGFEQTVNRGKEENIAEKISYSLHTMSQLSKRDLLGNIHVDRLVLTAYDEII